jgi:hypothetical protein
MNLAENKLQAVNTMPQSRFSGGERKTVKRQTIKRKSRIKGQGEFLRGWKKAQPSYRDRTIMMKRCGRKCFLGPGKSFPICRRNTCKKDRRGIYAAFIRAREYETIKGSPKYKRISAKARRLLKIF